MWDNMITGEAREIEMRIVNDEEMPPIVITMNDNDEVKVIINQHHKTWLSIHRKTIGGLSAGLYQNIDELLDAMLKEQRQYERKDY